MRRRQPPARAKETSLYIRCVCINDIYKIYIVYIYIPYNGTRDTVSRCDPVVAKSVRNINVDLSLVRWCLRLKKSLSMNIRAFDSREESSTTRKSKSGKLGKVRILKSWEYNASARCVWYNARVSLILLINNKCFIRDWEFRKRVRKGARLWPRVRNS